MSRLQVLIRKLVRRLGKSLVRYMKNIQTPQLFAFLMMRSWLNQASGQSIWPSCKNKPARISPKQKEEQAEDSSPDPSSSACDIRIQKKGISRSFAESFPQKIVSAKLRPHCFRFPRRDCFQKRFEFCTMNTSNNKPPVGGFCLFWNGVIIKELKNWL